MGFTTIDQQITEFFNNNFNLPNQSWAWGNIILCLLAILLSLVLCGVVGLEREKRGRSAGLRTHLLVGMGSCILMIISIYGFPKTTFTRDVARLAAGVITGVGFLGAGAIIHSQGGIKGLTTASTIWLVMAIGMACGSMNFLLAIGGTIVVMIVLTLFRKFERQVTRSNPLVVVLGDANSPLMTSILTIAKDMHLSVSDVNSQMMKDGNDSCIELTFKIASEDGKEVDVTSFIKALEAKGGTRSIQVLNHH